MTLGRDEMLRRLIDAVPLLIAYVDREGRYRFNNAAHADWFGVEVEEIDGRHLGEVLGEATYRDIEPHVAAALSGQPVSFETQLICRRGGHRPVTVEYVPDIGPDGLTRGLVVVINDLTDRQHGEKETRRLNAELRRRVDELQAIFDAAPIGLFVGRDPACQEMIANRAGARMLGVEEGSNPSKSGPHAADLPFRIFSGDQELAPHQLPMQRAAAAGCVITDEEIQVRFPDGSETILSTYSAPLFDERGRVRGSVGTFVDVTERRRIEAALADMDRRKDTFLAVLAHELRNPLAAMQHALDAAENSDLGNRVTGILRRQISHLTRLVDDLLDVARINKGLLKVQRKPLRFDALLRQVALTLEPALTVRQQQLLLDTGTEPVWVEGDAVRLTQVFANLITNASKYCPAGSAVTLKLGVEAGAAVVVVEDPGMGIPQTALPHVFDPFVQAGEGAAWPAAGLGLGLTLVKELTELHGGSVEAHSDGLGHGSRFTVRLPVAKAQAPERGAGMGAAIDPVRLLTGLRVLVVEDNQDVAESLQLLLSACGAEVRCVYFGAKAAREVSIFSPRVVLLDIGMPDLSGRDVALALAELPGREQMSVVAVSGHARPTDLPFHGGRALFDASLAKPVSLDALCEVLRRLGVPQSP